MLNYPHQRYRQDYLNDEAFRKLQLWILVNPEAGDVIQGTGGLRKARFADETRSKGKRSGLRLIYYWWVEGSQFWLFTLYDKNELSDLKPAQINILRSRLEAELASRKN